MARTPAAQQQDEAERNERKTRTGVVISNKMQKTIVVQIARKVRHGQYDRVIQQASSFKAHDETNSAAIGDLVTIMETRPLSKDKRWRLVEIVKRASTAPPVPGTEEEAAPAKSPKPAGEAAE
jgi:small subunit ribosomal protein S17